LPDAVWKRNFTGHAYFGTGPEIVWLRIDIENNTETRNWQVVSDYSFLDKITLYSYNSEKKISTQRGGDTVPVSRRVIKHHLPVFPIELTAGKNRIWIRVESKIGKRLGFTLYSREAVDQRDSYLRNPYPEFFRFVVIISLISLLCAIYLRNLLFLLYILYIISLTSFMGIWEGYALFYFYPENPGWNDQIQYSVSFIFGFFLGHFWKRLLSLSVQLPWFDRFINLLLFTVVISAVYALTPFSTFPQLDLIARIVTAAIFILIFAVNIHIVRLGQRYAVYSIFGCMLFFASFFIFVFEGTWFFPGIDYMSNPIYIGFSLELIALILSLLSRVRFYEELRAGKKPVPGDKEKSYLRISKYDIRNLISALDKLMKEEKVFRKEEISLEYIAGRLSITRHQLSALIKDVYNTNYYGFINDLRINEAKNLLVDDRESTILSVALAVGYNSKSTFNQAFKKHTGLTPREYRESYQE
jgi:AraC-like DNA-binding protein